MTHDMRNFLLTFAADRPELLDYVHAAHILRTMPSAEQPAIYPEHLSVEELTDGIRVRRFLRGALRVKKDDWRDCYVIVHEPGSSGKSQRVVVHVQGKDRVNRALDGDIVAVEILEPGVQMDLQEERTEDGEKNGSKHEVDLAATEAEPTFQAIEDERLAVCASARHG
ncbi:hypothetical protein EON64_19175, partial [archaeon]